MNGVNFVSAIVDDDLYADQNILQNLVSAIYKDNCTYVDILQYPSTQAVHYSKLCYVASAYT